MTIPQSQSSDSPSSSVSDYDTLEDKLRSSAAEKLTANGSATNSLSANTSTAETRRQVLGYVAALDDTEFAALVTDARGGNATDAAAATLDTFIRNR